MNSSRRWNRSPRNLFSRIASSRFSFVAAMIRPYVDQIVLVSSRGERMMREPDLIDVWFDSGAMPYAQAHYPFEIDGEEFHNA